MGGGGTDPRGHTPGQRIRWLVCAPIVLLLAGFVSGSAAELGPPGFFDGLEEVQDGFSLVLPETVFAAKQLWWWGGTVVPLFVHRVLGEVHQGLWDLVGAPFASLIEDAIVAFDESGETQGAAMSRLTSTVLGLGIGLLLLPVAVRSLEKGLRVVTAVFPQALQRFVAKRVARFAGKALTYVTLSLTAAEALG